ncbi:MAG: hypothetical protein MR434_00125, partial [Ruminococcus sp.]|nr:hypothetical protein [Ruminococcus sp.]
RIWYNIDWIMTGLTDKAHFSERKRLVKAFSVLRVLPLNLSGKPERTSALRSLRKAQLCAVL